MNVWLGHAGLSAVGLAMLGMLAWLLLWSGRLMPTGVYRLLVLVIIVAVLLPPVQIVLSNAVSVQGTEPDPRGRARLVIEVEEEYWYSSRQAGRSVADDKRSQVKSAEAGPRAALAHNSVLSEAGATAQTVLFVYVVGAAFTAVYQGARLIRTSLFLAQCRPLADASILALWRQVAGRSPLCSRVRLVTSRTIRSPCCWGLVHRYLVLPVDVERRGLDALEWSLRHELVHLERRDGWMAVGQSVFLAIYWCHPVAWWLSRQLDWWREASCDQVVVERTGQRRSYARALVRFAELSDETVRRLCPAFLRSAAPHSQLWDRVKLLARVNRDTTQKRGKYCGIMALAMLSFIATGQLAAALNVHRASTHAAWERTKGEGGMERVELVQEFRFRAPLPIGQQR
jgi:beta-lactamase regulating signal transducer with metallopeptidase domain